MSVALFIYQDIFCRYMCPGECIVHDRGEFCSKVMRILNQRFNCDISISSAGRSQGNGQAEAYVKVVKNKMKARMVEASSNQLCDRWDESLLYFALQVVRSDPSGASGYLTFH